MCVSTRFAEAIPLRNIRASTISKAVLKFFTIFGLPKEIQSDQGSNFMSGLFQQLVHELGAKQIKSSAYHPQSQGALDRFHSTLKTMIKIFCHESEKDWDEGIPFLLFATRESVQESLGFSPFELVFGHTVRGPLKLVKEIWLSEESKKLNLLDYVSQFKERLRRACEIASENLKVAQCKMETWYDKKALADTLSRLGPTRGPQIDLDTTIYAVQFSTDKLAEIQRQTQSDKTLLTETIVTGWPDDPNASATTGPIAMNCRLMTVLSSRVNESSSLRQCNVKHCRRFTQDTKASTNASSEPKHASFGLESTKTLKNW